MTVVTKCLVYVAITNNLKLLLRNVNFWSTLYICSSYAHNMHKLSVAHFTTDTSQCGRSHKLTNYRLKRDKKLQHGLHAFSEISWNTQHNNRHHSTETVPMSNSQYSWFKVIYAKTANCQLMNYNSECTWTDLLTNSMPQPLVIPYCSLTAQKINRTLKIICSISQQNKQQSAALSFQHSNTTCL